MECLWEGMRYYLPGEFKGPKRYVLSTVFVIFRIMEDTPVKGEAKFGYGTMQYFLYSL